jgi:small conductance mechanosensitive channel
MLDNLSQYHQVLIDYGSRFGLKLVGAVALWVVGSMVINTISRLAERGMTARRVDATLIRYSQAALRVVMRIALVIAVLSIFGIETTSFAALIAAAGVAIGVAWSGLLANFASGIFLMILRPFKVGDVIAAGGVTGTVVEIGLFASTIHTAENLCVTVGNNKLFADNIINYSANEYRRVDSSLQLAHGVDPHAASRLLLDALQKIPHVLDTPAPSVGIAEFNHYGIKLAVHLYCTNPHFGQVSGDLNKTIYDVIVQAGWPVPALRQVNLASQFA